MASVYAATHRNRNRVAVKVLHPSLAENPGLRARFLNEGYAANAVGHPGAVQVLDDDVTEDGLVFLVMELLSGETPDGLLWAIGAVDDDGERVALVANLHAHSRAVQLDFDGDAATTTVPGRGFVRVVLAGRAL